MRKLCILAWMLAFVANVFASAPDRDGTVNKHWNPNPGLYANNMTVVGIVTLNGDELRNASYEIGAFCGEECRGSELLEYYATPNKYLAFLTVYGEDDDVITFRLYNHDGEYEYVEATAETLVFEENAMHGVPSNPYVFAFDCPTYSITCQPNVGQAGTVSGGGSFFFGQTCVLQATPLGVYHFIKWTENGVDVSQSATYSFVVETNHDFVAHFHREVSIAATVSPEGSGNITGTGTFYDGDPVSLTATANTGWSFVNWTENGSVVSTNASLSFTAEENRNLVANFEMIMHNVSVTANIGAAGTVTGGGEYQEGTQATVSAQPNTNFEFVRWTENGTSVSTNANYTFTVLNPRSLVAEFKLQITDTVAESCESFAWHGETYTSNGIYYDTLTSVYGIDSIVALHLTIHPTYHFSQTVSECGEYEWFGETLYESGDYEKPLYSVYGCDSIFTLHLTIRPIQPLGDFTYMSPADNYVVHYTERDFYWDPITNADKYDFYFWQGDGGRPNNPTLSNTTSVSYHATGLTHGTTYHWCVVAKNDCVVKESDERSFTCQLDPSMTVVPTGMMDFGEVSLGQLRTKTIAVSSVALTEDISYSYLDSWSADADYFTVNPVNWNPSEGGVLNVIFTPVPEQLYYHSAIRIASGAFADTIYFTGSVANRYVFTTEVDNDVYSANDTIDIHGHVDDILGTPISGMNVTVYMTVMGVRITMPTVSDANGDYVVHYIPAYSESGYYQVGSCAYGDYTTEVHDAFDIPGMGRVNSDFIIWNPYQYDTVTGMIEIRNRSRIPISNIQINDLGLPAGCIVDISGVTELGPLEVGQLYYSVTGTIVSTGNDYVEVPFELTSDEGVTMNMTCYYYCRQRRGSMDIYPPSVTTTMQRNAQKVLSFQITNRGNGETGPITVSLPDVEWMSLVGDATMESLQVGDSCSFSIMLFPDSNVSLNQFTGHIAVNCTNGNGTSIPYNILAVADASTDLVVDVTDDATYNTMGGFGPHLAGANVTLTGYYSLETVAQGMTDENGLYVIEDVPEGYYYLSVYADSHYAYNSVIQVDGSQPTRESREEVFLQYQAITYSWVVVPTEIEDEYVFELVAEIKTNVPVPVVTVQCPTVFDPMEYGDTIQFNMIVRNDGLVDACGVEINMPTQFSEYKFSSMYDFIDTLRANTTMTVPCALTRLASRSGESDECVEGSTKLRHHYYCNALKKWVEFYHPVRITTHCPQTTPPNNDYVNNGSNLVIGPSIIGPYYPGVNDSSDGSNPGPAMGPTGPSGPSAPFSTVNPITIIPNEGDCTPCWKVVSSLLMNLVSDVSGIPVKNMYDCAINTFDVFEDFSFGRLLVRSLQFGSCVITTCLDDAVANALGIGRIHDVVTTVKDAIQGFRDCYRTEDEPLDRNNDPMTEVYFEELEQIANALEAASGILTNLFGDEAWLYEPNLETFMDNFLALVDTTDYTVSTQALQQLMEVSDLSYVTDEHVQSFMERWNRSVQYWDAGYTTEADLPAGYNPDFIQQVSSQMNQFNEAQEAAEAYGYSDMDEMLSHSLGGINAVSHEHENDVCAKITLQFNQTMMMTREAFEGTLKIHNGHTFNPMQDIDVNIVIKDEDGVDHTDLFQVNVKSLSQLTGVDGSGSIAAQTEGTVVFEMIPTIEAAPETPQFYSFGGSFTFLDPFSGEVLTYSLFPVRLQVNPSPNLHVDYFLSRHIISDDPLTTDTVEATEPAELAMMIRNVGAGDATNVYLQSAQPQVIENQNGLLINFNTVGSAMNGVERPLGLTDIPFGTIESHTAGIAEWFFTSSLLSRVINATPQVIHNNSYGNPMLSLVTEINAHELIKAITAYGSLEDGINDFFVNETEDFNHVPDMIYFSNGGTASVSKTNAVEAEGVLSESNNVVLLHVTPVTAGWNYACIDDPAQGLSEIVSCTRDDGQEIPLNNVWVSHVTMLDDGAPVHENKLHIVDTLSVNQATTYTLVYEEAANATTTQAMQLNQGWNWWSSYIDLSNNGLEKLENALGSHGLYIKSQHNGFATYDEDGWYGNLHAINNKSKYRIQTDAATSISMTGTRVNASQVEMTLTSGWNWIGYPLTSTQTVASALSTLDADDGDQLKSQTNFSIYDGEDGWFGGLRNMMPGQGYMYYGEREHSFTYSNYRLPIAFEDEEEGHWAVDVYAYPDNMSVVAMLYIDGIEQGTDQLEVGAYGNGQVVGSTRLLYNAKRNRWFALIPVSGNGGEEVSFRLFDHENGIEYEMEAEERINFASDGILGSLDAPMALHFNTKTGMEEKESAMLHIYPNPVMKGGEIRLSLPSDAGKTRVEIYNILDVMIDMKESTSNVIPMSDNVLPGTYILRIFTESGKTYYGKLIVK